ncbi:type II toxin-antitoxin system RelE/ParE family toxin [Chryseobacterium terrae]|uniref:Type II toxin-antitoxin system RelE/ParE family toxin n=1 Tax=Chryseobacterium terrae TaxID=3163299 RepID=A0ABW8XZT1_9FLAO
MVEIIWSSKALFDKKEILKFWISKNKSNIYSKKLNFLIEQRIKQVLENPNSGIQTNIENIRAILVENYYIHYSIKPEAIQILRIWDARQNPEHFTL